MDHLTKYSHLYGLQLQQNMRVNLGLYLACLCFQVLSVFICLFYYYSRMNEPHDVPDINLWAQSVQAAVTAIRNAGATSQIILLPGNDYTSAAAFVSNGSGAALLKVTNPDGSTTNLVFDVHKYLDSDNSGTHAECTTNNISEAWEPLAHWLRCNGRQAFNTETGGGNVASCEQLLCQQVAFQQQNSDGN